MKYQAVSFRPLPLIILLFLVLASISMFLFFNPPTSLPTNPLKTIVPQVPIESILDSEHAASATAVLKLIHMTLRDTTTIKPRIKSIIESWRRLNPEWTLILYNDIEAETLIASKYPEFIPLYQNLLCLVERTDLWR
jgi:mannosyltransferase OCH1-like enzyme